MIGLLVLLILVILVLRLLGFVTAGPDSLTTVLVVLLVLFLLGFFTLPGPYGYHYFYHSGPVIVGP